jgi:hypothetical protein
VRHTAEERAQVAAARSAAILDALTAQLLAST